MFVSWAYVDILVILTSIEAEECLEYTYLVLPIKKNQYDIYIFLFLLGKILDIATDMNSAIKYSLKKELSVNWFFFYKS